MDCSRDEEKGRGGEEMKAVVFTLGCKVNSCESESLMAGLKAKGHGTSEEMCAAELYRMEEHTSQLQALTNNVSRLLF